MEYDPRKSCVTEKCHVEVVRYKILHGPLKIQQCVMCHLPLPGIDHKFRMAEQGKKLCMNCHKPVLQLRFMHKDVTEGRCLNCHSPHGSENKSLLRKPTEDELCRTCHKDLITKKYLHIRTQPETCTPCHRAHGGNFRKFLKDAAAKGCVACHKTLPPSMGAQKAKNKNVFLHQGAIQECTACHNIHDSDFKKLLKSEAKTLCLSCHKDVAATSSKDASKHSELVTDADCFTCHTPHASPRKHLLKDREDSLCFRCHEKLAITVEVAGQKHTPVLKGECTLCHNVHRTKKDGLFKPRGQNCLSCHKALPKFKYMHSDYNKSQCQKCHSPHAGSKGALLKAPSINELCETCHADLLKLKFRHVPASKGGCVLCHKPHGGAFPKLLARPEIGGCVVCHNKLDGKILKKGEKPHSTKIKECLDCHRLHDSASDKMLQSKAPEFCLGCHTEIQKATSSKTFKHGVLITKASCSDCHQPHFSQHGKLLKDWEITLCATCHDKIISRIIKAGFQHGPITKGECSACHSVHVESTPKMLKWNITRKPLVPYEPGQFALCFKCHPKNTVEEMETSTATQFRNGTQNLHYVHLIRTQKGHTCTVCHDPHAGADNKLMRESFVLMGWEVPLKYLSNENGGACQTACHNPMKYDRLKAVINPKIKNGSPDETD